jgi:hypothetical protein
MWTLAASLNFSLSIFAIRRGPESNSWWLPKLLAT